MKKKISLAFIAIVISSAAFSRDLTDIDSDLERLKCYPTKQIIYQNNYAGELTKLGMTSSSANIDVLKSKNDFFQGYAASYDLKLVEQTLKQVDSALEKEPSNVTGLLWKSYLLGLKARLEEKPNPGEIQQLLNKISESGQQFDRYQFDFMSGLVAFDSNDKSRSIEVLSKLHHDSNAPAHVRAPAARYLMNLLKNDDGQVRTIFTEHLEYGIRAHTKDNVDPIKSPRDGKFLRESGKPIFLYFTSNDPNCRHCTKQNSIYEGIKNKYKQKIDFVRVDFDPHWKSISNKGCFETSLRETFDITGLPTTKFYSLTDKSEEDIIQMFMSKYKKKNMKKEMAEKRAKEFVRGRTLLGHKENFSKTIPAYIDFCFKEGICSN